MLPLQTLLRHGTDPCIQSSGDGDSALHFAALYGSVEKCELLITSSGGKALRLRNNVCQTPLLYAALYG
jgi:ankyrin repeat protein